MGPSGSAGPFQSAGMQKPVRRSTGVTGAGVFLLAALLAIAVLGLCRLCQAVLRMDEFVVRRCELSFRGPWVSPEPAGRLLIGHDDSEALSRPGSIFAGDQALRIRAACRRSEWVRSVRVQKILPNRIKVVVEPAEPFALIRTGGRYYCVGEDGTHFNPRAFRINRLSALQPRLVLLEPADVPGYGERWSGASVRAGLELVRICREQLAPELPVRRIEVRLGD